MDLVRTTLRIAPRVRRKIINFGPFYINENVVWYERDVEDITRKVDIQN